MQRPKLSMCLCTLLADVASMEQQQCAKDFSKDQEEEIEDILVDMEEQEELTAVDTEQLKPQEVKAGVTASSGECHREQTPPELSDLDKLLRLYYNRPWF